MALFQLRKRKKNIAAASKRNSLPPSLAKALRESWWLLLIALASYLILILSSYNIHDPSWSHASSSVVTLENRGGRLGAWLADVLLSVFGLSAWWLVLLCIVSVKWTYHRIDYAPVNTKPVVVLVGVGFILILTSSASLEALRLHSLKVNLPLAPGGMLGLLLGGWLYHTIGFTGATILLIFTLCIGISLFSGFSWTRFMEVTGYGLEIAALWLIQLFQKVQDKKIGRRIENARTEKVLVEKKKLEDKPRVRIEPAHMEIPLAKPIEKQIEKAQQKSIQPSLFADYQPYPDPSSELPSITLLDPPDVLHETISIETLEFTSRLIERKLMEFGVEVKVLAAYPGPVITRYEIEPATGVKGSQIVNLMKDLARALGLISIRVVETIPGKTCMGLELPNPKRQIVRLTEILGSDVYHNLSSKITLVLGKDISGKPIVTDLAKAPHMLVAGTTGSGKSVAINAMILSLLYKATPEEVRLIMVDPKMLELSIYEGIPHLLAPVVTDMKLAANALNWCVAEMERRYKLMSALGVRNLAGFNQKIREADKKEEKIPNPFSLTPDDPEPLNILPLIVIVIDELADLMMVAGKKIEELIARLAQKARAAGIHLILATQRPSVDVITGLIKANIPTRVAFQVSSKIDSRTILDQMGAEALLGQGDMLFLPPGTGYPQRVHGAFVADEEVHRVVEFIKAQGEPDYIEGILYAESSEAGVGEIMEGTGDIEADPLYDEAVATVLKTRRASISAVQRQLRIGYNRAARLIEQMEVAGIVSAMESNGNRTVLAPSPTE
jgi:S-DNA-T family DNA segregation ATPase FtsK/SpoIIIE